jgi:hypothetical protein
MALDQPQSRAAEAWRVTRGTYTTPRYLLHAVPQWLLLIAAFVTLWIGPTGLVTILVVIALVSDVILRRRVRRDLEVAKISSVA